MNARVTGFRCLDRDLKRTIFLINDFCILWSFTGIRNHCFRFVTQWLCSWWSHWLISTVIKTRKREWQWWYVFTRYEIKLVWHILADKLCCFARVLKGKCWHCGLTFCVNRPNFDFLLNLIGLTVEEVIIDFRDLEIFCCRGAPGGMGPGTCSHLSDLTGVDDWEITRWRLRSQTQWARIQWGEDFLSYGERGIRPRCR